MLTAQGLVQMCLLFAVGQMPENSVTQDVTHSYASRRITGQILKNSGAREHLIYSCYKHVDLLCFFRGCFFKFPEARTGRAGVGENHRLVSSFHV